MSAPKRSFVSVCVCVFVLDSSSAINDANAVIPVDCHVAVLLISFCTFQFIPVEMGFEKMRILLD